MLFNKLKIKYAKIKYTKSHCCPITFRVM